ncbi:MAG: hypothetical protein ACK5HR_03190 [Mycoplasmatales bacterium]
MKIPQSKNTKDEEIIIFLKNQCNTALDTDDFEIFYEIDEEIEIKTHEVEEAVEDEDKVEEVIYRLDNILNTLNIISNDNSNKSNNNRNNELIELSIKVNSTLLEVVNEINEKLEIIDETMDDNRNIVIKTSVLNIVNPIMMLLLVICIIVLIVSIF